MDPKKIVIRHAYNLEHYTPKLWEQLILKFIPLEKSCWPEGCVYYKHFADRLYIYRREFTAPAQLKEPFTGGRNSPWLN